MRYQKVWIVGEWSFYEIEGTEIHESYAGRELYGFGPIETEPGREPKIREWYNSLDHAMVAAIAEKHTGARGAGGTGVGTAADWFMRMIGAGQIQEAGPEGGRALMEIVRENADKPLAAHKIERALEAHGLVIARQPIS